MYGQPVTDAEIELSTPRTVSVSTTSTELSPTRLGRTRRTSFLIVPLTAGVTVTITKGEQDAVANQGYVLTQNQPYVEATSEGFLCYQGALQVVASSAGSVSIVEVFEV